jgi:hypothetical protein
MPAMDPSPVRPPAPTSLPPTGARVLAFLAILVAGACGALIGWAVTDLQADSTAANGIGALVGAVVAAGGVAVIAVLVLRAMGEWRTVDPNLDGAGQPRRNRR